MKQKTPPQQEEEPPPPPPPPPTTTTSTAKNACKSPNSLTPSRLRPSSKTKEFPKTPPELVNGVAPISSTRAKSVTADTKNNSGAKRGLVMNNAKPNEDAVDTQKGREAEEAKTVARFVSRHAVEQFARLRRVLVGDFGLRRNEEEPNGKKKEELQEKLDVNESLIKNLQSQVLALRAELDGVKRLNEKLKAQNKKLTEDLAAAEAKVVTVGGSEKESIGEHQNPKFKHIQRLIAEKLERSKVKEEALADRSFVKAPVSGTTAALANPEAIRIGRKPARNTCLPPPPPPIPPPVPSRPSAKAANTQKASAIAKLFHSINNREGMKHTQGSVKHQRAIAISAHSSIVGEIQNRSAHLLAIRKDIETKGEFINGLIKKVVEAAYTNIEEVLKFVDWLDGELSSLADERAVLKHFNWPEKKADAMREAAVEYRELKLLEREISSYTDDPEVSYGASLKKITSLLDKSECSIKRIIKLHNSVMPSYQEYNIPTAWMLDSGIVSKIQQASKNLVKIYIKRVTRELGSARNPEKESNLEPLLIQGMHFAYRVHQFAGGLDAEALCALEEIRQRVPGHLVGSRELLAGITSS